ncbi:hypothetical protein BO71DRAFT_403977 [Aspergillus ellipticus CBS 707.79]|uniref:Uncharacterized protein n=1 Tax=Aspergillus ellipticus CBS 707.79 TaxID=1448320 RepID=A0A319EB32_9EURO|nr:hypothetical protein BO71DRAFT_403977 [Aspergillus ellipticus CBS 707.79]
MAYLKLPSPHSSNEETRHVSFRQLQLKCQTPAGKIKRLFGQIIRSTLQWVAGDRKTVMELSDDPWLNGSL